jgi:Protein of unknown function (DUF1769)
MSQDSCRSFQKSSNGLPPSPDSWPQAPLLFCSTPKSQTNILRIRYDSYPSPSSERLNSGCMLPINTGAECPGRSLVVDFESKYFVGTILLRIRDAIPLDPQYQTMTSYFDGKKRSFQVRIQGQFKQELSMSQCFTGQWFDRPSGKLPAQWIVFNTIKLLTLLSPQLDAKLDDTHPRFLSPLMGTANTVLQESIGNSRDSTLSKLELDIEEPPFYSNRNVLHQIQALHKGALSKETSVNLRIAKRKKYFNQLSIHGYEEPKFSTQTVYCFEFYQHMLSFGDNLELNLGNPLGRISLTQPLNGQPLKCLSLVRDNSGSYEPLWSFDIWHADLYPLACHNNST